MRKRITRTIERAAGEVPAGLILLLAAVAAVIWANSPWSSSYFALGNMEVGPTRLGLHLPLNVWAADGVLAFFFFVVGLELKQELTTGSLRNPRDAAVPMVAAIGGMVLPALIFTAIVLSFGQSGAVHGWAIPTATDIAFAVTIQALFGKGLPGELRTFLLTLAVVDDLLAIIVIAVFYAGGLDFLALGIALALVGLFAILVRTSWARWFILVPLAALVWFFMHRSGVHATISGVLLGLVVPARAQSGDSRAQTHRFARYFAPFSALVALPIFAFFASGVTVAGPDFASIVMQPVTLAVAAGMLVGKFVGVLGTTWAITRITPLRLPGGLQVRDLVPIGFLAGIGFTVALLVTELAFGEDSYGVSAKVAILSASAIAGVLGALSLTWDRHHRHA